MDSKLVLLQNNRIIINGPVSQLQAGGSTPILRRYALRLFDETARNFRDRPCQDMEMCLRGASEGLRMADVIALCPQPRETYYMAEFLNSRADALGKVLLFLNRPPFSFEKPRKAKENES